MADADGPTSAPPASTALTDPAPPAPPAPEPTPAPPEGPWTDSLAATPELQSYARDKGWADAGQVVDSYRNLEKLHGVPPDRLLKLPAEGAEAAEWGDVYAKLGRPAEAAGYELDDAVEAEAEIKILPAFREKAHEMGLSQAQARNLADWYQATMTQAAETVSTKADEAAAVELQAEMSALRQEWGAGFDEGDAAATRALKAFVPPGKAEALREALGLREAMNMLRRMGEAIGEHRAVDAPGGGAGFEGSPSWAAQEIRNKMSDPQWVERYQRQSASKPGPEFQLMQRLQAMAHPAGQVVT